MPENLIVAVDVGNSRVKFGVLECGQYSQESALPACLASIAVAAAEQIDWVSVRAHLDEWVPHITTAVIAGPALLADSGPPLGRNTREAIGSGLWFGQIGAIREIIFWLAESAERPPQILVTGGNGRWLAPALRSNARFEPDLALRGLAH